MQDKTGAEFDPAIHYSVDGVGVLTKSGLWRKRTGKQAAPNSLIARLERMEALVAERDARIAELERPSPKLSAERQAAEELLAQKAAAPPPPTVNVGPGPQKIPYSGLVQAVEECFYGQFYKKGEVFHVDVPVLWSDDPFVPVRVVSDPAEPIRTEPNTSGVQLDTRFRPRDKDAFANATPISRSN